MDFPGNRLGNFSLTARRAFVGIALVPCAVAVADHYLGWQLFGDGADWPIPVAFMALFLTMRFLGPTVQQLREYRDGASDINQR